MLMKPPEYLIGNHPQRGLLWAAIDPAAHHIEPSVAETRFGGYVRPFRSLEEARAALIAAGAEQIDTEEPNGNQCG